MSQAWFRENVSRETFERLKIYEGLVRKWNPAINLVSRSTLENLWDRHFLDSWQVVALGQAGRWTDLGSGGGFPGMIVAVAQPERPVTLVEADRRKSAFLATVARETGVRARILSERIEDIEPQGSAILSARALAPLSDLLAMAHRHLDPEGIAIFPKGSRWREEKDEAEKSWRFHLEAVESKTDPQAVVLKIGGIARV